MHGVLHPSCVTMEYCRMLLREYSVLDCAQLFTLMKKHGNIGKKQRGNMEKVMIHLQYLRRIKYDGRSYLIGNPRIMLKQAKFRELTICFWILLDYIDKVDQHHATGTFSRISMDIGGKDYSVVYVAPGLERFCNTHMAQGGETRYFVVVDSAEQIPLIKGDNIHTFATVTKSGQVQYYGR